MKALSSRILAIASLSMLAACSAPQASVTGTDDWKMDDAAFSSDSGPYLELDDEDDETVELRINASSVPAQE